MKARGMPPGGTAALVSANLAKALRCCGFVAAAFLSAPAFAQSDGPCKPLVFDGARYTVCTIDLRRHEIELVWRGADGQPYGSLSALARSPAGRGVTVAMNAGMYHADLAPVGLYVEGGRQIQSASTANGPGNFHLKPNGVFYVASGTAGVLETRAYLRLAPKVEFATQSGPMLVIDGRIHPRFSEEGPSRKIRNGVGVRDSRTVVLAISDEPVSFGAFARLFRTSSAHATRSFSTARSPRFTLRISAAPTSA
jgi:uncharacterized protein YigE (DUF2233 family)